MDELVGFLIGAVAVIAIVVWLVQMVLAAFTWTFAALTGLFGHPVYVVALLTTAGAGAGLFRLRRRYGVVVAKSSDDFAEIGPLRLTAEGWVVLILSAFAALVSAYGMVLL